MARSTLWTVGPMLLLAACGSLGLDPAYSYEEGLDAGEYGDSVDEVEVPLTGRTYAAPVDTIEILQPAGLNSLLHDYVDGALLFHVTDEDLDRLSIVMTLGFDDGAQDACTPVYDLPEADWTTNPELAIEGGSTQIDIANQPVLLDNLSLVTVVSTDGGVWQDAHLRALLDTRDLLGGSLAAGTDVCELVENMGGECRECSDGVEACAVIELVLDAIEVDTNFDMDAGDC